MSRRYKHDGRGTEQHLSLSKNRIGRGRNRKDWTEAPDQRTRMGGGEKELLSNVANSIRVAVEYRARLTDHGHDGARDQVPVCVEAQRHHWLNVEHFLRAVERPGIEIRVALERNADEVGDRILRFLRQVFVFGGITPGSCRRDLIGKAALEFVV